MPNLPIENLLQNLAILVVDHNAYMRRTTRMMLLNLGGKSVIEAADGLKALEQIRHCDPDVMLLDWDLPVLNGMEVMRIVRSPGVFPKSNLPTIMLTGRASHSYVLEAMRVGVHEFLVKPTSPKELHARLLSVMLTPRPMLKIGNYYVPSPRETPLSRKLAGADQSS
jgi:two-component system, chemotaxis family, chemotaxis protein CheY